MTRLLLALAALAAMAAVSSAAPSMTERQLMERLLQKLEKRHEEGPHGHTHGPMETKPPKPTTTTPPMDPPPTPVLKAEPADSEQTVGASLSLRCVPNSPSLLLIYVLYKGTEVYAESSSDLFELPPLTLADAGAYSCSIVEPSNLESPRSAAFELTVISPETTTAESSKDRLTHEELRELKAVLMALEKRGYKMRKDFAAGTAGDLEYAGYVWGTVKTKGTRRVMFDDGKEKEYGLTAEDQAQVYVQELDMGNGWPSLNVVIRTKDGVMLYKTVKANDVIILS